MQRIKVSGTCEYLNRGGRLWSAQVTLTDGERQFEAEAGGATPSEAVGLAVHFADEKRFAAAVA